MIAFIFLISSLSLSTSFTNVTVFRHGEGGYPCIRIPSITRCGPRGTLHAFAECRTFTGDGCVPTSYNKESTKDVVASLCYKNSTDDGSTWSKHLVPLIPNGANPEVVCDKERNVLILQYNPRGGTENGVNFQITSSNDGATWTKPQRIDLGSYGNAWSGPGRGLQLSKQSPAPGRLLFIGHHNSYQYDIVWYSDDGGKTYQTSETPLEKMDEAQLVEIGGGIVMANMRNSHLDSCDCRAVSLSKDGGKTFGNITYDPALISPVCMATILQTANGSLIFANPASKTERANGLIRRSDDNGKTWPFSYPVTTGQYAYSCLTHVASDSEVGLLWETEDEGCVGPSCQLVFSKVKVF